MEHGWAVNCVVSTRNLWNSFECFSCDQISIQNFFDVNWILLNRNPKLIFNMDETLVDSNRKLKEITPEKTIPLTIENSKYSHITGVVTVCADGFYLDPFIILPNKKTAKNIESFVDNTFVVSTASGWMNKDYFIIYALYFCAFITHYRMILPRNLRDEPILLIVTAIHLVKILWPIIYSIYLSLICLFYQATALIYSSLLMLLWLGLWKLT